MKWIAISGSWRNTNKLIENEVRSVVREIIKNGDGIISGGALGVDFFATDEILKSAHAKQKIKIFLPTPLETYRLHYAKRAEETVITKVDADGLIVQLEKLNSLNCLFENTSFDSVDEKSYFDRTCRIIENADELIAFHINNSRGTQDAIDQAREKGIPVRIFSYTVDVK